MDLSQVFPMRLIDLIRDWVVPLLLLFNVVGWLGLPGRELNRSRTERFPEEEVRKLGHATWAAWVVGIVAAMALLWGVATVYPGIADKTTAAPSGFAIVFCGIVGFLTGLARAILPACDKFRKLQRPKQRKILASLVFAAVTASVSLGVLYYAAGPWLSTLIASGYVFMFVGYAIVLGFQAAK